jgi:hypothetical protein
MSKDGPFTDPHAKGEATGGNRGHPANLPTGDPPTLRTRQRKLKKGQTMRIILLTIALIPLLLWGCATATPRTGAEFNSSVVIHIKKGITTTSQILKWLGEPYNKDSLSRTEEMWLYSWSRPTANMTVVPFGHRNIGTTGYKKTLWLFIKDGVVVNFTYEEGII